MTIGEERSLHLQIDAAESALAALKAERVALVGSARPVSQGLSGLFPAAPPGLSIKSVALSGGKITVTGEALSAAAVITYATALAQAGGFSDVTITSLAEPAGAAARGHLRFRQRGRNDGNHCRAGWFGRGELPQRLHRPPARRPIVVHAALALSGVRRAAGNPRPSARFQLPIATGKVSPLFGTHSPEGAAGRGGHRTIALRALGAMGRIAGRRPAGPRLLRPHRRRRDLSWKVT